MLFDRKFWSRPLENNYRTTLCTRLFPVPTLFISLPLYSKSLAQHEYLGSMSIQHDSSSPLSANPAPQEQHTIYRTTAQGGQKVEDADTKPSDPETLKYEPRARNPKKHSKRPSCIRGQECLHSLRAVAGYLVATATILVARNP